MAEFTPKKLRNWHDEKLTLVLFGMLAILFPAVLSAQTQPDPIDMVMTAAADFVRQHQAPVDGRLEIDPLRPDARLRLDACEVPLAVDFPAGRITGRRMSVRVSCPRESGWAINVMLDLRLYRTVLVTTRPLARGSTLASNDLIRDERDTLRLPYGFVPETTPIEGMRLARAVPSGAVLSPAMLAGQLLVRSGSPVALRAHSDNIEIRAQAMALEDGIAGAHVRVRNTLSGRIVSGIVEAAGVVVVPR